jgi:hypothetical protein
VKEQHECARVRERDYAHRGVKVEKCIGAMKVRRRDQGRALAHARDSL